MIKSIRHYRPEPARAALVVVDIQEKLSMAMRQDVLSDMVTNILVLIEAAKEFDIPVLVTEQYPKGLGQTLEQIKAAIEDYQPIEKLSFSCMGEPEFCKALDALDVEDVILCGMETHVCMMQTVLDLLEADYEVFVPFDALCSRKKANWKQGLKVMEQAGAVVGSVEMFLFEMLKEAGTEKFKKLSRLIK